MSKNGGSLGTPVLDESGDESPALEYSVIKLRIVKNNGILDSDWLLQGILEETQHDAAVYEELLAIAVRKRYPVRCGRSALDTGTGK